MKITATVSVDQSDTTLAIAQGWAGQWAASFSVTAWDVNPDGVYGPIAGARLFPSEARAIEYALATAATF